MRGLPLASGWYISVDRKGDRPRRSVGSSAREGFIDLDDHVVAVQLMEGVQSVWAPKRLVHTLDCLLRNQHGSRPRMMHDFDVGKHALHYPCVCLVQSCLINIELFVERIACFLREVSDSGWTKIKIALPLDVVLPFFWIFVILRVALSRWRSWPRSSRISSSWSGIRFTALVLPWRLISSMRVVFRWRTKIFDYKPLPWTRWRLLTTSNRIGYITNSSTTSNSFYYSFGNTFSYRFTGCCSSSR